MPKIEQLRTDELRSYVIPSDSAKNSSGRIFSLVNLFVYIKRVIHCFRNFELINNQTITKELSHRIKKLDIQKNEIKFSEEINEALSIQSTLNLYEASESSALNEIAKKIDSLVDFFSITRTTVNHQTAQEAASLFSLINLGSAQINPTDTLKNEIINLNFTIDSLKHMLANGLIPENEKGTILKLIKTYSTSIELAKSQMNLSLCINSAEELINKKKGISRNILNKLQEEGEVYLATGYHALPSGHAIGLKLILEKTEQGSYVRGEVYNRGEGVAYHLPHDTVYLQGLKKKVPAILSLNPVPLNELSSSLFLDTLSELAFLAYPLDSKLKINDVPVIPQPFSTNFHIQDFYESALSFWPGNFTQGQKQTARSLQRGYVCTFKFSLMPIKENVSSDTGNRIKLKMRIDAMRNHLNHSNFDVQNIPQLEWALMKINRALQKLTLNNKLDDKEIKFYQLLCDKLNLATREKINFLNNNRNTELHTNFSNISLNFNDSVDYAIKPFQSKPIEESTEKIDAQKFIFKSPSKLIEEAIQHEIYFGKLIINGNLLEFRKLANEYLHTLAKATENDWNYATVDQLHSVISIANFLIMNNKSDNQENKYFNPTSMQLIDISKLTAEILKCLKAKSSLSQKYIDFHGGLLLKLLQDAGPQLRISHPDSAADLNSTVYILNELISHSSQNHSLNWDNRDKKGLNLILEEKKIKSPADAQNDPVVDHVYRSLEANPRYQSISLQVKGRSPTDLVERAAMLHCASYDSSNLPEPTLNNLLLTLLEPLIMGLGAAGKLEDYSEMRYLYKYSETDMCPMRQMVLRGFIPDNPLHPSHGLLCDAYYPWNPSEREIVKKLLDNRIEDSSNEFDRKTQNEQMLTARNKVSFGKTTLLPHEYQELLSITLLDETVIPQTIHYFQQQFSRLKDPRFQALFEAFLWTRHSDGKGSILDRILSDTNSQEADLLLSFLQSSIDKAFNSKLVSQQLILTRILAQVYAHLQISGPTERYKAVSGLLKETMAKLSNKEKPIKIQYWLVSLYPYISKEPELVELCRNATMKVAASEEVYHFENRKILINDYQAGNLFLSTNLTTLEGKLPGWVRDNNHYILSDKNPSVTKINNDSNDKDIEVFELLDQGIPTRITCRKNTFKISKLLGDHSGMKRWFTYEPHQELPEIRDISENHPCAKEGYFANNTQKWLSEKSPNLISEMLIISPKTQEVLCHITDRIIPKNNSELTLSSSYNSEHPFLKKLISLDDPKNILIWKDNKQAIQQFDFPNLKLHLKRRDGPEGIQWYINTPQGYFLDSSAVVNELEPYSHYIVLKNKKGNRIVLMPRLEISSKETTLLTKQSFNVKYSEQPDLLSYHLDKSNRIVPTYDPAHLLYLIHLALQMKNYRRAKEMLTSLSLHPNEWTDKALKIIENSWKKSDHEDKAIVDNHPYACAIRIKLRLMALYSLEGLKGSIDTEALMSDYLNCLDQVNSLSTDWLSAEDELNTLNILLKLEKLPPENLTILMSRYNELRIGSKERSKLLVDFNSSTFSLNHNNISIDGSNQPSWLSLSKVQYKMLDCYDRPLSIALNIRPGENFYLNFLYYYKIASEGIEVNSKEFTSLMNMLKSTRHDIDPTFRYFHLILLTIASKGRNINYINESEAKKILQEYPTINELVQSAETGNLNKTLLKCYLNPFKSSLPEWEFKSKLPKEGYKSLRSILPKIDAQTLVREKVHLEKLIPFKKPSLNANSTVKEFISSTLHSRDETQHINQIQTELNSLNNLEKFYQTKHSEPCVQKSFDRTLLGIQQEINKLKKGLKKVQAGNIGYTLPIFSSEFKDHSLKDNNKEIFSIQIKLKTTINQQKKMHENAEKSILTRIQTYPPDLKRQVDSGLIQPLGIKELIACFGRKDDETIIHANPSLKEHLAEIKQQLAELLVNKTELQILERSELILQEAYEIANKDINGWNSVGAINASNRFIDSLTAKRSYNTDDPAFESLLVFESLSNIRLRKEQVKALNILTGDKFVDVEFEASTGFGKSKVVIPLWLFLTSRKDRLTMMTVPTALLPDQIQLLQSMLGNMFSVGVQVIDFDRDKSNNLLYLKRLNLQLVEARNKKRAILLGIKSLHGLCGLALKQSLNENEQQKPTAITEELIQIRKNLNFNMSNFIDESRECLDIHRRYDYAIGQAHPIDSQYCNDMGRFYKEVVLHPDIIQQWNHDFLYQQNPAKVTITKEEFVKPNKTGLPAALAFRMVNFLKVDKKYEQAMHNHLLGISSDAADAYINQIKNDHPEKYKLYKMCLRQLVTHLPRSLIKKCYESYFLNSNRIAIPAHRGEPMYSSEFAKIDDLINLTIQANLKVDFDVESIRQYVDYLKNQTLRRGNAIVNDEAYKLFIDVQQKLKLPKLESMTDDHLASLTSFFNSASGFDFRLQLISTFILPRISAYPSKISGTPYTLVGSQYNVQAASGTPDPDLLPPSIKTIENPRAPIGNLHAIWKNSKVFTTAINNPKELLINLILNEKPHRVITDAAGYFNTLSREEIFETILNHATKEWSPPINGVAYYDSQGRCMIREKGSLVSIPREESTLKEDEIMVFINQSKAIGSDTPMTSTAKGWVTFGRDVTENLMLQAAGRMRGLMTGQSVDFFVMNEDATVINQKLANVSETLNIGHLLKYAKIIEAEKKGMSYYFGLRLYLDFLIEQQMWTNINDPAKLISAFRLLENILVESTETDLMSAPSAVQQIFSPKQAVDILKKSVLQPLKDNKDFIGILDISKIETAFDKHVDFSKMPQQITSYLGSDDVIAEVEHNKIGEVSELEQDLMQEQQGEAAFDLPPISFVPSPPIEWDGNYNQAFKHPKQDFLGLPVYFAPNFAKLEIGKDLSKKVRKQAYQHLLKINNTTGKIEVLALDLKDMQLILNKMKDNQKEDACPTDPIHQFYLVQKGKILASDASNKPLKLSQIIKGDQLIKLKLLGKILLGDQSLSHSETNWIIGLGRDNKGSFQKLLDFARDYLSVWPHIQPLVMQIEALRKKIK